MSTESQGAENNTGMYSTSVPVYRNGSGKEEFWLRWSLPLLSPHLPQAHRGPATLLFGPPYIWEGLSQEFLTALLDHFLLKPTIKLLWPSINTIMDTLANQVQNPEHLSTKPQLWEPEIWFSSSGHLLLVQRTRLPGIRGQQVAMPTITVPGDLTTSSDLHGHRNMGGTSSWAGVPNCIETSKGAER